MKVDEAAMTGEGEVVKKSFERDPMLYAGTQVRNGREEAGREHCSRTGRVCVCVCVRWLNMSSSRVPSHPMTQVKEGSGTMLVTAVGAHSKKGMILKLLIAREANGRSSLHSQTTHCTGGEW